MKKKKKITPAMRRFAQEVAADILMEFTFVRTMDDVDEAYKRVFDAYELRYDPFTYTPCSPEEYDECREEYDRQMMEQRYGYCDF